jgi:GntR family transcriptional repressor for pyruvate dehydrogenase complex
MEFAPIKSRRVVETVVERLEEPILNGTVSVGEKLPSEGQLATQLGVGRRAVREALKVLETKGLVETQMGVGTVVCRNDLDNFLDTLARSVGSYLRVRRAEAKHVMELRRLLEGAALERLAREHDTDTVEQLSDLVVRQKRAHEAQDYASYQVWHFRFHQSIIDSLHNPVISLIYEQVMALMRRPMERSGSNPDRTEQSIADHEQILRYLQDGNTTELRKLLQVHLKGFYVHMQDE